MENGYGNQKNTRTDTETETDSVRFRNQLWTWPKS